MDNSIIRITNPLWFVQESSELLECSEGGLANQLFDWVDSKISKEQKNIFADLIEAVPVVAEMAKGLKKTQRLKLVFDDDVQKKIKDGVYHLMKKKDEDGVFKAVVVDGKGKIRAIANLKMEDVLNNVDIARLTSAMQAKAIQHQLREIAVKLEEMNASMEEVLMGQYNDRLALFYCGEAIYREALATQDVERRKQLVSSAIMQLTNAVTSFQATLSYDIKSICDKYDEEKGRFTDIRMDKLKEKMVLINTAFQTIHKATTLKAAIYFNEHEYAALTTVLADYKSFLERSLSETNATILYLADPNDKKLEGSWNIRQNELPARIDSTRKLLANANEYALEVKKGDVA